MPEKGRHRFNLPKLGLIPIIVFPVLIILAYFLDPTGSYTFNPPNLLSILNTIFVTGTGIVIAAISAKSYIENGQPNLLLLGSAILMTALASFVGGWLAGVNDPANVASNWGVTTHNLGMLGSSFLQLLSALVTSRYLILDSPLKGKKGLLLAYLLVAIAMAFVTVITVLNITPPFFTASGATAIRQLVLSADILFFAISSFIFFHAYTKLNQNSLYWYSLALALFAIGLLAIVFQVKAADASTWVGRLAQYTAGFYFILALMSLHKNDEVKTGLSQRWADAFASDQTQIARFFKNLLNGFIYGKIILDTDGKPIDYISLDVNDSFERIIEVDKKQIIGQRATLAFPDRAQDIQRLVNVYGNVALTQQSTQFESYLPTIDKWLKITSYSPQKGYFISIFEDITQQKEAQEGLQKSSNRSKLLSETTAKLLVSKNPQAIINDLCTQVIQYLDCDVFFNFLADKQAGKLRLNAYAGIPPEEAQRIEWLDYGVAVCGCVAQGGKRIVAEDIQNTPDERTLLVKSYGVQAYACNPLQGKDGTFGTLSFGSKKRTKFTDEELDVMRIVADQVSIAMQKIMDERSLQESKSQIQQYANQMESLAEERARKLKDAERLAAIGATAGMVGHDIRNPLQAITSDVFIAKSELEGLPEGENKQQLIESLVEIETNVDYINKIVQDLQDYARPLNPKPETADLKQIIEKIIEKNKPNRNIKISIEITPEARYIKADPYYLNRILYNLIINSIQAMPKGGKLKIAVTQENAQTILSVTDSGVGIPHDIREKMFTPMFTTKSKGQGFGLPVVKRMTESLGGSVSFESEEGKGTTFLVRLPIN